MPKDMRFQILLNELKKARAVVEDLLAENLGMGSENEPDLDDANTIFNAAAMIFLNQYLNEVRVRLLKNRKWDHPQAVIEVSVMADGFKFRIPTRVIDTHRGLSTRMKKMSQITLKFEINGVIFETTETASFMHGQVPIFEGLMIPYTLSCSVMGHDPSVVLSSRTGPSVDQCETTATAADYAALSKAIALSQQAREQSIVTVNGEVTLLIVKPMRGLASPDAVQGVSTVVVGTAYFVPQFFAWVSAGKKVVVAAASDVEVRKYRPTEEARWAALISENATRQWQDCPEGLELDLIDQFENRGYPSLYVPRKGVDSVISSATYWLLPPTPAGDVRVVTIVWEKYSTGEPPQGPKLEVYQSGSGQAEYWLSRFAMKMAPYPNDSFAGGFFAASKSPRDDRSWRYGRSFGQRID